jgi:hypothetical protein
MFLNACRLSIAASEEKPTDHGTMMQSREPKCTPMAVTNLPEAQALTPPTSWQTGESHFQIAHTIWELWMVDGLSIIVGSCSSYLPSVVMFVSTVVVSCVGLRPQIKFVADNQDDRCWAFRHNRCFEYIGRPTQVYPQRTRGVEHLDEHCIP